MGWGGMKNVLVSVKGVMDVLGDWYANAWNSTSWREVAVNA